MTRKQPTPTESAVAAALESHLVANGHVVSNVSVEDRPDVRMFVDGSLCGFELVQIPPRSVMTLVHTRFKQLAGSGASFIRVVWPQEPDYWVETAIIEKQGKLGAHRRNLGSSRVSLVVHTPIDLKQPLVRVENPEVMKLIRSAATHTQNEFEAIYFYDSAQGFEKLSPVTPPWPKLRVVLIDGYPTDGFVIGKASFKTTAIGEPPVQFDFGVIRPKVLLVPPQNPEYKKYKPRYLNPPVHASILAGSNGAKISLRPVDE